MSKWLELAQRCEQAMGPDRDIERCMCSLIPEGFQTLPNAGFTSSLDAITALIDRELPGSMRSIRKHPDGEAVAQVWNSQVVGETPQQRCCASEALALCAAFCRAMAAKQADGKAAERKNAFENGCGND